MFGAATQTTVLQSGQLVSGRDLGQGGTKSQGQDRNRAGSARSTGRPIATPERASLRALTGEHSHAASELICSNSHARCGFEPGATTVTSHHGSCAAEPISATRPHNDRLSSCPSSGAVELRTHRPLPTQEPCNARLGVGGHARRPRGELSTPIIWNERYRPPIASEAGCSIQCHRRSASRGWVSNHMSTQCEKKSSNSMACTEQPVDLLDVRAALRVPWAAKRLSNGMDSPHAKEALGSGLRAP